MVFLSHSNGTVSLPSSLQQDVVEADVAIRCPGSAGATQLAGSGSHRPRWSVGELALSHRKDLLLPAACSRLKNTANGRKTTATTCFNSDVWKSAAILENILSAVSVKLVRLKDPQFIYKRL